MARFSMASFCSLIILLLAALTPSAPTTIRNQRATNTGRVILGPISTTKGGVNHAYWFRRLFDTTLSERELECVRNATFLYRATGRCEWLFEQGPCARREWLVLSESGNGGGLRAVCRPRPCAPGYGFLADENRCAPQKELCAGDPQRVFRYSLRGDGRCHCKGFRALGHDGACHVLFHRGPCPQGQMLAPTYNSSLESLRGACEPNPCQEGQVRVEAFDGKVQEACKELNDLDCSALPVPLLSAETGAYVPLCDDPVRNVIVVHSRPSRNACPIHDNNGKCVAAVTRSPQAFDWSVEGEEVEEQSDGDHIVFPSSAERR